MKILSLMSAVVALFIFSSSSFAGLKENVVELAKPDDNSKVFGITHDFPNFKNVAFAVKKENKMFVQFNDKKGQEYLNVAAGTPIIAPETGTLAYIANTVSGVQVFVDNKSVCGVVTAADRFIFSPDGKQYAFRVLSGAKQYIVINGVKSPVYEEVRPDFTFSPDSKRFVYIAVKAKDQFVLVENGIETKTYTAIKEPVFSPDSKHLAFSAFVDKGWVAVKDGIAGKNYENIAYATFSPDSQRFVYVAQQSKKLMFVEGAKEGALFRTVSIPVFSPDSRNVMYPAQKADKWVIVSNDKEGIEFDTMGPYFYSPDSKRKVYVGIKGNKACVVENDAKGDEYASVGLPVFSPDSRVLAYQAFDGKLWKMVMNGKEGNGYKEVKQIEFGHDSSRFAYIAMDEDKNALMVTEKGDGRKYSDLGRPFFSKDGRHLAYSAFKGKDCIIVVNGEEGKERFEGFMKNVPIVFDASNKLHALVMKMPGPTFHRLEVELSE